jgi:hypothetical protein
VKALATIETRANAKIVQEKGAIIMQPTRQPQPIIEILGRVAAELTDLAKSVDRLHCLVENIDRDHIVERRSFIHSAQAIDIIEQRLSGLAHFVLELGELMPGHWEVVSHTAAENVKLSELSARLSNKEPVDSTAYRCAAGESDFF